ncbi:MAG: D-alanyl-D-alanine carboxypeptidase family protein [Leucobacter sp.]
MTSPRLRAAAAILALCASLPALAACAPEARTSAPAAQDPAPGSTPDPEPTETPAETPAEPTTPAAPAFDKTANSVDDPMSIWVVSNKLRPLDPLDFAPSDLSPLEGVENEYGQPLREPAARAVERLMAAAAADGQTLWVISAYRDYATQVALYDGYVARDGQEAADTYSARPGHSEHQTGLAVDFDDHGDCYLAACFADTPAGAWLAVHAHEYGFILRYPEGKQDVTGFMPEPWHFRYVGTELAEEMRTSGVTTLEEFFGLPAAPDYAG